MPDSLLSSLTAVLMHAMRFGHLECASNCMSHSWWVTGIAQCEMFWSRLAGDLSLLHHHGVILAQEAVA